MGRSGRQMPSASLKIKSIISDQERLPTGRRSCFISEQCRTAVYLDEKGEAFYGLLPKSRDARADRQSQGGENDVQVNLSTGDTVGK